MNGMNSFAQGDAAWHREQRGIKMPEQQRIYELEEANKIACDDLVERHNRIAELAAELAECKHQNESFRKTLRLHNLTDDRYYELLSRARRVWRYYGVNSVVLDAAIREMDKLIQRHEAEISDEDEAAYEAIDSAIAAQGEGK